MLRKPLFWDLFWLIFFIAFLHVMAAHFYIYWTVPFFDILMHFLGGFWVGLTALWIFFISEFVSPFKRSNRIMLFAACIAVLTIGLGWEVFEFMIELTTTSIDDKVDTIMDIFMDLLGAVCAFLYFKYRSKNSFLK